MNQHTPFKIYSNCILVKGISRSTINDLQRNKIHLIPNSLTEIISVFDGSTINSVKENFEHEYDEIIDGYFDFLDKEEIIFYTSIGKNFPPMEMQWHTPFTVRNCIIDIDDISDFDFPRILNSLNNIDCKFLEIRSYSLKEIKFYLSIANNLQDSTVSSLTLIIPFDKNIELTEWEIFCDNNKRVTEIIFHSSDSETKYFSSKYLTPITYSQTKVVNEGCCGKISESRFIASTEIFTESLAYNSCLNAKISIDINGNIKNCPSMKESFGNIKDTELEEAISKPGFKKYWNITKDEISKCKDCEFRHVCTDCRAYLENPDDIYSAPLKCGYDPYTCEWQEWSQNPLKLKAIEHYGISEITNKF